jgi:uncharacterized protein
MQKKIAIVGSGISGLAAAHALKEHAHVTLYEANNYFGGHTNTVNVTLPSANGLISHGIDTGFLVFNERTYPNLIKLFADLDVKTAKSDMSFSVQVPQKNGALEWSGSSLNTVFAQRKNLISPKFWGMLADLRRFNAMATSLAQSGEQASLMQPLEEFLQEQRFSDAFRDWYLLPMLGCIWSCPTEQMLQFPVATMVRFCHNHGLLQVNNRPQWWTVAGGAKHYVEKIVSRIEDKRINSPVHCITRSAAGVGVVSNDKTERYDKVIIATHSDQALNMLQMPSHVENNLLSAIKYQANVAVLHTDSSVLPKQRSAWAAWNYESTATNLGTSKNSKVCLHYLINMLQPIPFEQPVIVSLNPSKQISEEHVLGSFDYAHPVFDKAAIIAQAAMTQLQGKQNTYFCGAWMGYGFHEDGLKAGLAAAEQLLADTQWQAAA